VAAPLAVVALILASVAFAGCGSSRRACAPPEEEGVEALRSETLDHVCDWQEEQGFTDAALPGARLFATSGCLACHTYLGDGSPNVGGSDLSSVGQRHDRRFYERFVADPARYGNDVMPRFKALGPPRLRQLAVFLVASKGAG
jgi:Cytochrome c